MAIARISGNILQDDLQRGSNLSIQGNLVYFDVTNDRVGVLTSSPDVEFTVNGSANITANVDTGNLISSGIVSATGNVTGGNLTTAGDVTTATVTASGNVSGGNLISTGTMETGTATFTGLATFQNDSDYGVFVDQDGLILRNNGANIYDISAGPSGGSINALANKSFTITTDNNNYAWTFYDDGILDTPGNVEAGGNVVALGNVTGGNLNTSGQVVATGNVSGGNLISSGSLESANVNISGTTVTSDANLSIATSSNGNVDFDINGSGVVSFNTTTSLTIPVGNTAQRPGSPETGALRFNSTTGQAEIYDGAAWDSIAAGSFANITSQEITGDGSTVTFTLDRETTAAAVIVSTNGVVQLPDTAYTVTGNQITFAEAPISSDTVDVRFNSIVTTVSAITNTSGVNSISVTTPGIADMSTVQSLQLPTYTVTEANALANVANGQIIYVSNGDSGNPCLAVYSAGAWKISSLGGNITT